MAAIAYFGILAVFATGAIGAYKVFRAVGLI